MLINFMRAIYSFFYFLLFILVFMIGCKPEPINPGDKNPENTSGNSIDFGDPQVGQTSYYSFILGRNDGTSEEFKDTLSVSIISVSGNRFLVEEKLVSNSESITLDNNPYIYSPSSKIEYWMDKEINTITFSEKNKPLWESRLLSSLASENYIKDGSLDFPLTDFTGAEWEIENWGRNFLSTFYKEEGYLLDTEINGYIYKKLNLELNNSDSAFDGNGYVKIYNKDFGIVYILDLGSMIGTGIGWKLIH